MAGFTWAYNLSGGTPLILEFVVADTEVISAGELLNLESNEATAAATNDAALIGAALQDVDNTADGLTVKAIANPDAVYSVADANARAAGATLDIATGGMGVAASSNVDLIVVRDCAADEPTLVMIAHGEHYLN